MSEFHTARVMGQVAVKTLSPAELSEVNGSVLVKKVVSGEIVAFSGNYLRDARILDMAKPLMTSAVRGQIAVGVVVPTRISDVTVLVLQSQSDLQIADAQGGLQQARIY